MMYHYDVYAHITVDRPLTGDEMDAIEAAIYRAAIVDGTTQVSTHTIPKGTNP